MDLSSNDSFLWTDASNDSGDNTNKISVKSMEDCYEGEAESGTNYIQNVCDTNLKKEKENKKKHKKAKKRNCTEVTNESDEYSQPERKQIKLEPESDMDVRKKRKLGKEKHEFNHSAQDSFLYDADYLNLRVKQEQSSGIETKKNKKHKRFSTNTEIACESDFTVEQIIENNLDMRVKQEQASLVETMTVKSRKHKKHRRAFTSSDMDIACEIKSILNENEATVLDNSSANEYSITEEKFSAEETTVEKTKQKKHKTDAVTKNNNNDKKYDKNCVNIKSRMISEADNDNINNNDMPLESTDFTCNNIVNSTIINSSPIDLIQTKLSKTEELKSKYISTTKISDRIRFEEDDNSSQELDLGKPSPKISMFLKVNPNIELCTSITPKDSIITKNDEIWTLTWPCEINIDKLTNATISSEGKCKIKIDGQTYEGALNENVISITLLTQWFGQALIRNLPVNECINYHKRIPKVHIPDNSVMVNNQTNFTPLPETKCRHPLFGAHYKKSIKISSTVAERLQAVKGCSTKTFSEVVNKKKYKKNKCKPVDIKMEEGCMGIKAECESSTKRKKRKHSQDNNVFCKKSKLIKHNADSAVVWESEKAIEENLFNF